MTQYLPTFPSFIARRFSRNSDEDEPSSLGCPNIPPTDSAAAHSDDYAHITFPTVEEEEFTLSSASHGADPAPDRPLQPVEEASQSTLAIADDQAAHEHIALRRVREHALLDLSEDQAAQQHITSQRATEQVSPAKSDTSLFSFQEAAGGLRSPASSISSSVLSAQDVALEAILPEDDGMAMMRARIMEVQRGQNSSEEKARQMLAIMTERYSASQASLHSPRLARKISRQSPSSSGLQDPECSIESFNLNSSPRTSPSPISDVGLMRSFTLTAEDRQPTYYQRTRRPSDGHGSSGRGLEHITEDSEDASMPYGCLHYKRNIKLQCSTCERWYTCRFCHDIAEDHKLIRRATKHMLCMFCSCAQVASGACIECGQTAAWYYCDVCKLWEDNPSRSIYHCNDCGICRVGQGIGKDFYHCKVCSIHFFGGKCTKYRQDLWCLSRNWNCRFASMYRALDRLRLSDLRRVHVHIPREGSVHEMRAQHP